MIVQRKTWRCPDCQTYFKTWADEEPSCPRCSQSAGLQPPTVPPRSDVPAPPIMSERTKIQTHVAETAMADMGLTDMRDNQREGDIAAPPLTSTQREIAKNGFWGGAGGAQIAAQISSMVQDGHQIGGVDKGHAMRIMQNHAKALEGLR
ncbi:MAG: hypothetical protein KGL39_21820 [Patescibacteria group bacterium]|nr:hypothetical protein [Patescibacteria group bacterium]